MLSLTWNAPQQAFDDPTDFFEAKGVDAVYFPFHKANQFLGMTGLPTFLCVDVMKRPAIEADVARYEQHLAQVAQPLGGCCAEPRTSGQPVKARSDELQILSA
jgi:modulator of drug activity B